MIITIDGAAGTGKSSVAKQLAQLFGFVYFDTGALYRAIAWKLVRDNIDLKDDKAIKKNLKTFTFHIQYQDSVAHYFVGESDVTQEIRFPQISSVASQIAALGCVRQALRPIQLEFAQKRSTVFEGRDLGTGIFPVADLKFFLTARVEIRAQRRLEDLQTRFPEKSSYFSYTEVLEEIKQRDHFDSTRLLDPLKKADDAIVIDTSDLCLEEVIALMKEYVEKRLR